jgi:hypothetical protein
VFTAKFTRIFITNIHTKKQGAFRIPNTKQASLGDRRQAMHTGDIVSNTLIILVGENQALAGTLFHYSATERDILKRSLMNCLPYTSFKRRLMSVEHL